MEKVNSNNLWDNKYIRQTAGAAAGYGSYKLLGRAIGKTSGYYFTKALSNYTPEENQLFKSAQKDVYEKLKDTVSCKIIHLDETTKDSVINSYWQIFDKGLKSTNDSIIKYKIKKSFKKIKKTIERISQGKNAAYDPMAKNILINNEKTAGAFFHELGHAIEYQTKNYSKSLSTAFKLNKKIVPALFIASLLSNNNEKNESPERRSFNIFGNIIEKNIIPIAMILSIPKLIDEGLASLNANKITKEVLSKELHKKMNKINAIAFGSYLTSAIAAALLMKLALNIKNKILESKATTVC